MLTLLRQRNYALLWVGGLISVLGDWVFIAALPFYVYNLTGSALASGGLFIALTVPNILLGSVAGVFADRWDRRRVMVAADFSRAAVLLLLFAVRSPDCIWLVYAVAALDAAISRFFSPAKNALLPQLAGADHLVAANALGGINNSIGRLLGPALGGVLLGAFGLPSVVVADSLSYLISGVLIARISVSPSWSATRARSETPGTAWTRAWTDWLDGLRLVRRSRSLTIFFIVIAIAAGAEGIYQVIFVVFVKQALHGGAREFGWLLSTQAIGGLLGGAIVGWFGRRLAPHLLVALLAVAGLAVLVLAIAPSLPLALALYVIVGVPAAGYLVGFNTVLQNGAADRYRGRLFGAFATTWSLLVLLGQGVGSALGNSVGSIHLLMVNGALNIVAGIMALALLRQGGADARSSTAADKDSATTSTAS